jgi:hypothetical protein
MSEIGRAWAAGFFDGEGNVGINKRRDEGSGRYCFSPRLHVGQLRIEPLRRFNHVVGIGAIHGPYAGGMFNWTVTGRPRVHRVLVMLWPYLSLPKRQQAHKIWKQVRANADPRFLRRFPIKALPAVDA